MDRAYTMSILLYRATMGDHLLQHEGLTEATTNTSPAPSRSELDDLVPFFTAWFDVDIDAWVYAKTGSRIHELADWSRVPKVLFFYRTIKRLTEDYKFNTWQALIGGREAVKQTAEFRSLWPYTSNRALKGLIRRLKLKYNAVLDRHNDAAAT